MGKRGLGSCHIDEVTMGEAPGLAGSSINSNPHINHILHAFKQFVQIRVRHLEGHVADEQCLGWRVTWSITEVLARGGGGAHVLLGIGDHDTTAFEELLMHRCDGVFGRGQVVKLKVAESFVTQPVSQLDPKLYSRTCELDGPLAQASAISDNLRGLDLTKLLELFRQIGARHVEEQVSNIDGLFL
jgi:hypothetical protein